eukprot:TRINITY_DN2906_c0_g1_i6.p1 TRINITY_DN2906_c0_g1~~TRINITY_DN2906_c0_g1_i6.p1  ORF type:complete len:121 (-),score=31.98 TRINITY_DN2906_c0_g1_i6:38-400(-)
MMGLVLKDILANGGVEAFEKRSIHRSKQLYDIIDNSNGFYENHVDPAYRSRMNVPFRIGNKNAELEKLFTKEAEEQNMFQLFGHPLFGGMRVTLYNGIPDQAVDQVAEFMKSFQAKHGSN